MAKNALVKVPNTPVKYTDGVDSWQALPGQPNGCFRFPGDSEEKMYSLSSLYDFLRKGCRLVKLDTDVKIETLDTPDFDSVFSMIGGKPAPSNSPEAQSPPAKKPKSSDNRDRIKAWMLTQKEPVTKKQIAEATGLSLGVVSVTIINMSEVKVKGKSGSSNLYSL
jgi:hypothetical protein